MKNEMSVAQGFKVELALPSLSFSLSLFLSFFLLMFSSESRFLFPCIASRLEQLLVCFLLPCLVLHWRPLNIPVLSVSR